MVLPVDSQGVENLFDRQDRMASYGPTFCDITWGAGGSTADLTLDIAAKMQNMVCISALMALPARHLVPGDDAHAACTVFQACANLASQYACD